LFEEISFRLNAGDRAGLIGKNGAGKSTLLKLLVGDMEYDKGTIAKEKDIKIGFLRQDIDFEQGRTVLEESYQAFEEIKALELKLDEINQQLAERTDYESESYNQLIVDLSEKILTKKRKLFQEVGECESNWQNCFYKIMTYCC